MANVVTSNRNVLGGTPVFAGTRVPIQTLIDHLQGGNTIEDFLEGFPTVSRSQVTEFLHGREVDLGLTPDL